MAKKFKNSEWETPSALTLKHKEDSSGLSITKNGRLVFTIKLQEEMKMEPYNRDLPIYVKVLFKKGENDVFFLQFFHEENKPPEAKYKLYKPKREKIFSSHFEVARFLKERGLIDEVGNADYYIKGGPVEIEKDIENCSLVIKLGSRLIKNHE